MYERRCPQRLDQPVLVWLGLEFGEIVASIGGGTITAIAAGIVLGLGFVGILLGVATGGGLVLLFRALRFGGPGYIFSRLYRFGLIDILPPGIRPRHLLPLKGREGRFHLSPVPLESRRSDRYARKYFGK